LSERGYAATLVTDEPIVATLPGAAAFDDRVTLAPEGARRAEDMSQTALARVFSAAIEQVEVSQNECRLLWVHSQGLHGPWDAPLALQEDLLAREEGDPPPADEVQPPNVLLSDSSDPDAAFRWSCAYAAQIMTLDACLEGLLAAVDAAGAENWLVVLCGLRGLPLGEHGQIGGVDGRLYAEQLHVPLVVRFPNARHKLSRSGGLALLADLPAIVQSAIGDDLHFPRREEVVATGPAGERAIRTSDWSLRLTGATDDSSGEAGCELYVRPDDRWEANDVAGLCPDVVEELLARLAAGTPA
jgi:hypothetical protein